MPKTIYARNVDDGIHEDLKAVSQRAGLSLTVTLEALLAEAFNRDHTFRLQVARARKTVVRGEPK